MKDSIIVGIFTLIGAGIGSILTYFLNRNSYKRAVDMSFEKAEKLIAIQEFFRAYTELRNVFDDILIYLNESNDPNIEVFGTFEQIQKSIVNHRVALNNFRLFLPKSKWVNFDRICEDYYNPEIEYKNQKIRSLDFYKMLIDNKGRASNKIEYEIKMRRIAEDRINDILEFAKY